MSDAITPFKIAIDHRADRRPETPLARDTLAGQGNAERLVAGHSARLRAGRLPLLGEGLRLARARSAAEPVPAIPHDDRRCRHPLHPRPFAARERVATRDDARLAGIDRRVSESHRTADESDRNTAATRRDAFHVVCPSLPGYGFSDKPTTTGWNVEKIGRAWSTLMPRLGYPKYVAQGGDWGAIVTTAIGLNDTANCLGIHLNMPIVTPDPATMNDLTDREKSALAGMQHYADWDSGYSKQQSTRPQTLGYGLADSPVGQAAWIIEKFWSWTDCDGHPENVASRDELLDNVMLYWLPGQRRVVRAAVLGEFQQSQPRSREDPTGCSIFPKEIFRCSRRWAEKRFEKLVTGTNSTKAVTSPRSSSRRRSSTKCGRVFVTCGDARWRVRLRRTRHRDRCSTNSNVANCYYKRDVNSRASRISSRAKKSAARGGRIRNPI